MHYSKVMLIRCGDDRYTAVHELAKGLARILSLEMATIHFAPGGGFGSALEFLNEDAQNLWIQRIKIAESVGVTKVVLIDHMACAAYELVHGKMSAEEERKKHLAAIQNAQTFFEVYAPKMQFVAYLQDGENFERIV
jgi:hypothetical protein